ncbi:MAG: carboxymuconolactone decarboxylase family protein [Actinobacteria bacterium]|nr:carboxymuconolactone decarboxylase family protein [Actinomycetota bacterium]
MENSLVEESLSGSWLSSRLGVGTHRLDAMRRGGELLGVRRPGGQDYLYPAWQFGPDGKPRTIVPRLIEAARAKGLSDDRLYEVLTHREGLSGTTRLADALRAGREDDVLAAVRSAAVRPA